VLRQETAGEPRQALSVSPPEPRAEADLTADLAGDLGAPVGLELHAADCPVALRPVMHVEVTGFTVLATLRFRGALRAPR
jgi:hypothetical protein